MNEVTAASAATQAATTDSVLNLIMMLVSSGILGVASVIGLVVAIRQFRYYNPILLTTLFMVSFGCSLKVWQLVTAPSSPIYAADFLVYVGLAGVCVFMLANLSLGELVLKLGLRHVHALEQRCEEDQCNVHKVTNVPNSLPPHMHHIMPEQLNGGVETSQQQLQHANRRNAPERMHVEVAATTDGGHGTITRQHVRNLSER